MGILEILVLVLGGVATFFGIALKSQVKKNAKLEVEKEAHKKTAKIAIKQQQDLKESEEDEAKRVDELIKESQKAAEDENEALNSNGGARLSDYINWLHQKNNRK